jgi:hypothetical protein
MNPHKTITLSLLAIALSLGGCDSNPDATMSSESGNPQSEPEQVVATPDGSPPDGSSNPSPEVSPPPATTAVEPPADTSPLTDSLPENLPKVARIEETQSGDLMCYVTVTNSQGNTTTIGAEYSFCNDSEQFLGRTLGLGYRETSVADCESNEPCGQSRQELLLSEVINLGENWSVLSNETWQVIVGQIETWDGVNNTGDLTYYGCDDENNCLALDGGIVSCRDGVCNQGWSQGDYNYVLSTPIVEDGGAATSLRVLQEGEEILNIPNLEIVNSNRNDF